MTRSRQTFAPELLLFVAALFLQIVYGSVGTPIRRQETQTTGQAVTEVSRCHLHETSVFCMVGTTEYVVRTTATATSDLPPSFTGCHSHDSEIFCMNVSGDDVEVVLESEADEHEDEHEDENAHEENSGSSGEKNCHFHAGVEHCVGADEAESEAVIQCKPVDRDYNIPLRIGLLFVILVTSSIGVFGPILLSVYLPRRLNIIMIIVKQFGTGVVISTAFVHLFTHASLMFDNPCLGELAYESTAAAILMAGLFISFIVEYFGHRLVGRHKSKKADGDSVASAAYHSSMVNIMVLEGGIIFHSILIGVTLVVAGDSFFISLFIVILFHQMFEGVALGSRIATLGASTATGPQIEGHGHDHHDHEQNQTDGEGNKSIHHTEQVVIATVSMAKKLLLATAFAVVTPIGMAIGIGVLNQFNGNDPATIWAIGTLDAFSAGILVWVGVVEMWAEDWMHSGEMAGASPLVTGLGLSSLAGGMVLMSLLGKWA